VYDGDELDNEHPQSSETPQSSNTGCHSSGAELRFPAKASKTAKKVDEAIVTIAERMSGTQCLQEKLEEIVKDANNPRTAWVHWMGTELQGVPDDVWNRFQQESFNMVMRYKHQVLGGHPQPSPDQRYQQPRPLSAQGQSASNLNAAWEQQPWLGFVNPPPSTRGINTSGLSIGSWLNEGSCLRTPERPTLDSNTAEIIRSSSQVLQGGDE